MATQLANNDSNDEVPIPIDDNPAGAGHEELISAAAIEIGGNTNMNKLALLQLWVAISTLVTLLNRVVSKLPPGAIFEGHPIAYDLILAGVFLAGVAEVYAAILLGSAPDGGRVGAYARPIVCASVVLLAAIVALGGSPVVVMG